MARAEGKKAFSLGLVCIFVYLVNYYLRNILSVLTPQMLQSGGFTVDHIGALSSVYMLFYAAGQLINGFLGDFISPKKLVAAGISVAGAASIVFPFSSVGFIQIVCFAILGFGLSMVRGPLMKVISENTKPRHARIICVFFSFSSFAGPLVATIFAMIFNWIWAFAAAGLLALIFAAAAFAVFTVMEKRRLISYQSAKAEKFSSVLSVFRLPKFVFYMVIAGLVEISATSISFWIPTYLTEHLAFDNRTANFIFSAISVVRALVPFGTLVLYKLVGKKDIPVMRGSFLIAAAAFICMLFAGQRWFSIALLLLALMAMSCSSALLWSIYIPGLGSTGKVSSVNGVLDFTGYVAAALANMIFSGVMGNIGWNAVFILWAVIAAAGAAAAFLTK